MGYGLVVPFYVYIRRMRDGRLYVGHTGDPVRRHGAHEEGIAGRTTAVFGTGEILYTQEHPDRLSAARRERQLKGWTRAKKLALAAGDLYTLHELAKRRGPQR